MTRRQPGCRPEVVIATLGLLSGIVLGLWVGWMLWPIKIANVDVTDLKPAAQDEYIVLVADAYVFEQDLQRARARLDLLNDARIADRIGALARKSAGQNDPSATRLAALAVALGITDNEIVALAATPTPSATLTPMATDTPSATLTSITTPSVTATAVIIASRTPTRRPRTSTPLPASILPTIWVPGFPTEWPGGVKFEPVNLASIAAGKQFWHLIRAQYCDDRDERNNCPNLPGGDTGTNIYVSLLGQSGARTNAPLLVTKDDGSLAAVDVLGPEKPPEDMCNCNFTFLANHWPIQVGGGLPSDRISGLGLYSVRMKIQQAHTRYYLTFQLTTR